ncbi:MAG: DUF2512 family protein [Sedimentibacter sp.]|uniref:DUF2512 family protein n=1 Tax=Sedimentibacter sp. TaxID=1960295 RepID=UPI0031588482
MRTAIALLMKFAATFAASWAAFSLIDLNPIGMITLVAAAGTILNYLLGDLVILPSMGSVTASIGDGVLGAAAAYVIDMFSYNFNASASGLIVFAAIIAAAEYFFHIYLISDEKVAPNNFHREPPME